MLNTIRLPSEWSTMKKLIWLRGGPTGGEQWGSEELTLTAFAAPVTKTVTKKSKVTSCSVSFSPSQDLHGYDSPWPAGGGKNKIVPVVRNGSVTWSDVTLTTVNGELSISGTATASGGRLALTTDPFTLPTGTYTLSCSTAGLTVVAYDSGGNIIGNTISGDSTFTLSEQTSVYIGVNVGSGTTYSGILKAQIEIGSTSSAYTPYSNLCPISGWQGAEVYIEPTYDPTATPKASVTFGQTVYGGTAEIVSGTGSEGYAEVDLGTCTWTNSTMASTYNSYRVVLPNPVKPTASTTMPYNGLCSILKTLSYSDTWTPWAISTDNSSTGAGTRVIVPPGQYATADEAKAAFNGIKLIYELATPTPYTFPPASEQLTLAKGTNNAWAEMTND